jgi:hypothetical protein
VNQFLLRAAARNENRIRSLKRDRLEQLFFLLFH